MRSSKYLITARASKVFPRPTESADYRIIEDKTIKANAITNAESRYRVAKYVDLVQESHEKLVRIRNENTEISDLTKQLQSVEKKLSGKDVSEKVNEIDAEIQACKSTM